MPKKVQIRYGPGGLEVHPDPLPCSVSSDVEVEWQSDLEDWRVIFGPWAPVQNPKRPKENVASPDAPMLRLKNDRHEDLGHKHYVVVALGPEGKLHHLDPKLIVDS